MAAPPWACGKPQPLAPPRRVSSLCFTLAFSPSHSRGLPVPSCPTRRHGHHHLLRFLRLDFFFFFFPRAGSGARSPSHEGLRRGEKQANKIIKIKALSESAYMGLLSPVCCRPHLRDIQGRERSVFMVDPGCRQAPNYPLTNNLVTV